MSKWGELVVGAIICPNLDKLVGRVDIVAGGIQYYEPNFCAFTSLPQKNSKVATKITSKNKLRWSLVINLWHLLTLVEHATGWGLGRDKPLPMHKIINN